MSEAYVESCRGKAFGILLAVFLVGAVSGGLGTKVYDRLSADDGPDVVAGHAHKPSLAVERLGEELGLNTEQYAEVQSVLDECIMKEADLLTQLALTRTDGRERILKILDHQQREKFESLLHEASSK